MGGKEERERGGDLLNQHQFVISDERLRGRMRERMCLRS